MVGKNKKLQTDKNRRKYNESNEFLFRMCGRIDFCSMF